MGEGKVQPRRGVIVRYVTLDEALDTTGREALDTTGRDSHFVPAVGDIVCLTELGCPHDAWVMKVEYGVMKVEYGRVVERVYFHFSHKDDPLATCNQATVTCIVEPCQSPFAGGE